MTEQYRRSVGPEIPVTPVKSDLVPERRRPRSARKATSRFPMGSPAVADEAPIGAWHTGTSRSSPARAASTSTSRPRTRNGANTTCKRETDGSADSTSTRIGTKTAKAKSSSGRVSRELTWILKHSPAGALDDDPSTTSSSCPSPCHLSSASDDDRPAHADSPHQSGPHWRIAQAHRFARSAGHSSAHKHRRTASSLTDDRESDALPRRIPGSSLTSRLQAAGRSAAAPLALDDPKARRARARRREQLRNAQLVHLGRTPADDFLSAETSSLTPNQFSASFRSIGEPPLTAATMSGQQGKWREDQILVICPGSQTTLAQLGCGELTPPAHRFATRMFRAPSSAPKDKDASAAAADDDDEGEYRPFHTYRRPKSGTAAANGSSPPGEDDFEYVEDHDSSEGAIYPIQGGRIINMEAFLAFLDHVHSLLTTTYHNTPIVLMASPQWSRPDCETIARYIFEKTKTPALCLLHSAIAAQYGLKWPTMTVVDIGYEKVDVTCIHDNNIVGHRDLGYPNPERHISGGEVFTQSLISLLKAKNFTHDMAEQLKQSHLCEVLPYAPDQPELMDLPTNEEALHADAAIVDPSQPADPSKPAAANAVAPAPPLSESAPEAAEGEEKGDEGVLDVANIVTAGNTREFLAKKEKEKAEKAAKSKKAKGQEQESAAARLAKLPNSKRKFNTFHYEELVHEDVQVPIVDNTAQPEAAPAPAPEAAPAAPAPAPAAEGEAAAGESAPGPEVKPEEAKAEEAPKAEEPKKETAEDANGTPPLPFAAEATASVTERRTKRVRKDIEVGLERFLFANRGEIDRIVETIYRTIQSIDEHRKRAECWDNLVFVGNGSRLRGLKENIVQTLTARHIISPSTATIFTSELPSNMATPSGTGSQTPTGSFTGQLPSTSSVNPLLQAATTASAAGVPGAAQAANVSTPGGPDGNMGASIGQHQHHQHHPHGQTPMSIKLATLPTYLAEWTKNGFEESMFLGSLVAARLAFCIHNLDAQGTEAQRMMSLNRVDFNEMGPKAIRGHSMLGGS